MEPSQKLPAGLAGVLNEPEENRDSAYYSSIDHASKHNSTQSTNGTVHTPSTDVSSAVDKTPSPISTGTTTQPLNSPASGGMSVASMVSPTSPQGPDSARFSHHSYESAPHSAGFTPNGDSRRESVDSRLGANFGDMRLASSPYASQNQSTTSIQSTLAQQRNPGSVAERNSSAYRFSNGYQPQRLPDAVSPRSPITSRTAPTITGPALGNIARAPEPTKGQAWAFPEEPVRKLPSGARPSGETANRDGISFYDDSRRNSFADSIASSQYTTESRLPPGQRRLEEGIASDFRLSRASSDFQSVSTHHHSLQHRQLSELQDEEGGSPGSSQPYSRTPELRVSHKLAERKRRTEMKELFDTLSARQHHERGSKASKWEILTKAISEDERKEAEIKALRDDLRLIKNDAQHLQADYQHLQSDHQRSQADISHLLRDKEVLQRENSRLEREIESLRLEISHLRGNTGGIPHPYQGDATSTPQGQNLHPAQPSPAHHTPTVNGYGPGLYDRGNPQADQGHQRQPAPFTQRQPDLPPLRNLNAPVPEAMSGVQYQHDTMDRPNSYCAVPARF